MGKYTVTNGQNIYDIALDVYGSIEGIVDLLMNNTNLGLTDDLQAGQELIYTDDFVIHADVVAYNRQHGLVPANGEQSVYPKYFHLPYLCTFRSGNTLTSVRFGASGSGMVEIDWGDNSPIEAIKLTRQFIVYTHIFNNQVRERREIRWYSDASFVRLDWSGLQASEIYLLRPLTLEELIMQGGSMSLDFLCLTKGMYEADFQGLKANNLLSLVPCRELMRLDLREAHLKASVLDEYFIHLAMFYGERRSCEVLLGTYPTGKYEEPERDENGRYRIISGMEALWVITHEPTWNEGGAWKFIIKDQVYSIE